MALEALYTVWWYTLLDILWQIPHIQYIEIGKKTHIRTEILTVIQERIKAQ